MERPHNTNIDIWVTLCSRTPRNCGLSPGAAVSDTIFNELTWVIASTVAATNHGRPKNEQMTTKIDKTNKSRWYPHPFCD